MDALLESAARAAACSRRTVVLTGAGISRESGIPTFREAEGLWERYRPEDLATREGFMSNPGLVWKWYMERLFTAREKEPNPGHEALARLEELLPHLLIVTQNIDNLHQRAGSREVIELHGSIERFRCAEWSHPARYDPSWGDEPPVCHCGSIIRPDVVWFGEPLPQAEIECAFRESAICDLFLIVGTSGLVTPAARLPMLAAEAGARLVEVNVAPSALTPCVDFFLEGRSGEVLPGLVDRVGEILEEG